MLFRSGHGLRLVGCPSPTLRKQKTKGQPSKDLFTLLQRLKQKKLRLETPFVLISVCAFQRENPILRCCEVDREILGTVFATICHHLPLFATIRDCSPLFALLETIRTIRTIRYSNSQDCVCHSVRSHLKYNHCRPCRILWPFMLAVLPEIFYRT